MNRRHKNVAHVPAPAMVHHSRHRSKGLALPRHRATTAHTASIYPFHAEPGLGARGVCLGMNVLTGGGAFCFDPFQAYSDGLITSPNIFVMGAVGSGKSAAVKTFIHRSVGLLGSPGGLGRWVAIVDPKGEYQALAEALGLQVLRLHPGGTVRLNPLDRGPRGSAERPEDLAARRTSMGIAMCSSVLRRPLHPIEDAAIGFAVAELGRLDEPTLLDLLQLVRQPTEAMAAAARTEIKRFALDIQDLAFALGKLLERDLRGMFDGRSTERIDWNGRGLVLDLSAVYHDRAALQLVMIAAAAWLQSYMATPVAEGVPRRVQVFEEAWAVLGDPVTARYMQGAYKLSRQFGVSNWAVAHRISDLQAQADDGTATSKIAVALLADTQTRILFRQATDQVAEAKELLDLTDAEAAVLTRLPKLRSLWKVAGHTAVVQHLISEYEGRFTYTDANLAI